MLIVLKQMHLFSTLQKKKKNDRENFSKSICYRSLLLTKLFSLHIHYVP